MLLILLAALSVDHGFVITPHDPGFVVTSRPVTPPPRSAACNCQECLCVVCECEARNDASQVVKPGSESKLGESEDARLHGSAPSGLSKPVSAKAYPIIPKSQPIAIQRFAPSNCANGNCGTVQRFRLFGRRR